MLINLTFRCNAGEQCTRKKPTRTTVTIRFTTAEGENSDKSFCYDDKLITVFSLPAAMEVVDAATEENKERTAFLNGTLREQDCKICSLVALVQFASEAVSWRERTDRVVSHGQTEWSLTASHH